jgi:hypothetical protein
MALPSALPPPAAAVSSQEKTKNPFAMRTKDTLSCFSELTERNYPSIETQDCRQTIILVKFSSYLEKLRQKPRVLLSCTHTHTQSVSVSVSLCVSLCTTQNPKHHDSTTTTSYYPPLPQKSATLSQENKIKNSNKRTIGPAAVIIIVVVVTSNSTTKTTPMIKKQLRKTNKICRNWRDKRRRSLFLFCLSLSLAVSVAVSSWCSAVSSRVHKGRN